jgi:hypothetical protein
MNRKEAMRQNHQSDTLQSLGFTADEAESLRRISMTLRRWFELECGDGNGCIERDEETQWTYWLNANTGRRYRTPDRETGARKRLAKIMGARNARYLVASAEWNTKHDAPTCTGLAAYIQTDPRGAALYIIRPGDIPEGSAVDSCYTRGICVY